MFEVNLIDFLPVFEKDGYTARYSTCTGLFKGFVEVIVFNSDYPDGKNRACGDRAYSLEYLVDSLTLDDTKVLEDAWNKYMPSIKEMELRDVQTANGTAALDSYLYLNR